MFREEWVVRDTGKESKNPGPQSNRNNPCFLENFSRLALHSHHVFPHYLTPTNILLQHHLKCTASVSSVCGTIRGPHWPWYQNQRDTAPFQSCQSLWWLPRGWDSPFSAQMKLETLKGGHSAWYTRPKSPVDNRIEGLCGWWAYNVNPWHQLGHVMSHDEHGYSLCHLLPVPAESMYPGFATLVPC